MNPWVVISLTVAALAVCWLLAWIALLLVFMWLVRRRCDPTTLGIFVKLAESWRMPATPFSVLASRAERREATRGRRRRDQDPPDDERA